MIYWTKKKYAEELKKGYWDLEPHFYDWQLFKTFDLFETFYKNRMSLDNVKSAMYGEFVKEGKPIRKGFYKNFNMMSKIINEIIKKNEKKQVEKNKERN